MAERAAFNMRLRAIENMPSNKRCCDCSSSVDVTWASTGFGTLHCLNCAGRHRGLGTHISLVRSTTLDDWCDYEELLKRMESGSNDRFQAYMEKYDGQTCDKAEDVHRVYTSRVAKHYAAKVIPATMEKRTPPPFSADEVSHIDDKEGKEKEEDPKKDWKEEVAVSEPAWSPDGENKACQICDANFSLMNRRHHCRRCGRCVCLKCAPKKNCRPIPEWKYFEPVRHCKECYTSPIINWEA